MRQLLFILGTVVFATWDMTHNHGSFTKLTVETGRAWGVMLWSLIA